MELIYARCVSDDYAYLEPGKDIFNIQCHNVIGLSPDQSLCIGWRFKGDHPNRACNYTYDHTNIWKNGTPTKITRDATEDILIQNNASIDTLLDYVLD